MNKIQLDSHNNNSNVSLSLHFTIKFYGCCIHSDYVHEYVSFFSDHAMKQFLLHLDETLALGRKFILQDLDETHLFISADILETLQSRVDDLMDQISFPLADRGL